MRQFSIYYIIFGDKVSWVAKEVNGTYEFSVIEDACCEQTKEPETWLRYMQIPKRPRESLNLRLSMV